MVMKKRMIVVIAALVVLVAGLGFLKFQQIRAAMAQSWTPPPEAVTTIAAGQEQWAATTSVIGSVTAVQGVTVSADLPGVVEEIAFESGRSVQAGQVLVRLDVSQERAQLAAADAQRDLARLNLDRMTHLREKQVVSQAEFDRATAEFKQADARAREIRAIIDRKQIRAPFTGVLGIRQINLGQYLTAGDPVVPLQSMDPVYVNFSVPQQDLGDLRIGAPVQASAESVAVIAAGRVTAINSVVDEGTRNVQIQAEFRNPKGRLRPGMFVEVEAKHGAGSPTVTLPATAVSYAPYGNSIFVVRDLKGPDGKTYRGVEQRFVKLGASRGDQVSVVSGLKPGEEVVTSGVFKLRNGASVLVNNEIRPGNNPAPKPEDS
jgi:membrane fusion protein (multidrug efflux system)